MYEQLSIVMGSAPISIRDPQQTENILFYGFY